MKLRAARVFLRLGGKLILRGISLEAAEGEITVILGPNGAGKTTLLRVLSGLLPPDEGEVTLDGSNIYSMSLRERARLIAYMPPDLPSPGLGQSVEEYVAASKYPFQRGLALGPSKKDFEEARQVLGLLQVEEIAQRSLGATSSGERQRAQLAHVFLRNAKVLVVDEPTSFQDLRGRLLIYSLLRAQALSGKVVVIATHDMTLASLYADHVVVINRGVKVAEGSPEAVMTPGLLSDVFRVEVTMADLGEKKVPIPVKPL